MNVEWENNENEVKWMKKAKGEMIFNYTRSYMLL